jgi:hypothetical protein
MTALPPFPAIALIALAASIIFESCALLSSTPPAAPRLLGEMTTMVPALVLLNSSSAPGGGGGCSVDLIEEGLDEVDCQSEDDL